MFIPILTYHKIQGHSNCGFLSIPLKTFERQIALLADKGYETISIADYIDGQEKLDKKIIITFDDAYASVYEFAFPVLKRYHFIATIFVITNYVGQYNSWDFPYRKNKILHCDWKAIEDLAQEGWEIGSHTVTHPDLKSLPAKRVWYELESSKSVLEEKIQKSVHSLAYPYGRFNAEVIRSVAKVGYKAGCTLGQNYPYNQQIPYALFRRGVYGFEPFGLFEVKLRNTYLSHFDDLKQKCLTFCAKGSILLRSADR